LNGPQQTGLLSSRLQFVAAGHSPEPQEVAAPGMQIDPAPPAETQICPGAQQLPSHICWLPGHPASARSAKIPAGEGWAGKAGVPKDNERNATTRCHRHEAKRSSSPKRAPSFVTRWASTPRSPFTAGSRDQARSIPNPGRGILSRDARAHQHLQELQRGLRGKPYPFTPSNERIERTDLSQRAVPSLPRQEQAHQTFHAAGYAFTQMLDLHRRVLGRLARSVEAVEQALGSAG
jgi:hypothetical protein